jgi:hypothetical protein
MRINKKGRFKVERMDYQEDPFSPPLAYLVVGNLS